MSEKLKPCPFCGKKASIQDCSYFGSTPMWSAMCDNPKCFAYTEAFKTKKEAVERWNNRPAEEALQKQIAELAKEMVFETIKGVWRYRIGEKISVQNFRSRWEAERGAVEYLKQEV